MNYDLKITKQDLKKYKSIRMVCENCTSFSFPIEYIEDIEFLCSRMKNEHKNNYFSDEGFIKLSPKVIEILCDDAIYFDPENEFGETLDDYKFINRIPRYLDICCITITTNENRKIHVSIPYDPIESFFSGTFEFTDCHSFEIDDKNNIIIKYGNLSLTPKRCNLNLEDIIENWTEIFKPLQRNYIDINLERFYYREINGEITVSMSVELEFNHKELVSTIVVFEGVQDFEEDKFETAYDIVLYQLLDGRYFAQIGNTIEFKFQRCYLENIY